MLKQWKGTLTNYSNTRRLFKTAAQPRERERETDTHTYTKPFPLKHMHTHKPFHQVITFSHPGPPSDINISVIRPKETPAVSKIKFRLEGEF